MAARQSRAQEAREHEPTREQEHDYDHLWGPTANLGAPAPRPGYVQRWVRAEMGATPDVNNLAKRERELWRPRQADTVHEHQFTRAKTDDGVIRVRGMILMERPVEVAESQRRYTRQLAQAQMARVEADLRDSAAVQGGMRPYVHKDTKTHVEVGRPMTPADD